MGNAESVLSRKSQFLYAVGNLAPALLIDVIVVWVIFYYSEGLGGRSRFLPLALLAGRLTDAVSNPLVGFLSDRTRSRFGRRKPFIALGTAPMVLCFILLWMAPFQAGPRACLIYLAVLDSLFFFFYTLVVCPYLGLLPEIATSAVERISLARLQGICNLTGIVIAAAAAPVLIESLGFQTMGLVVGCVAFVAFLAPLFGEREKRGLAPPKPVGFRQALAQTFANAHFRWYCAAYITFWFGFRVLAAMVPFLATVVLGVKKAFVAVILGVTLVSAVLWMPFVSELALAAGKRTAMRFGVGLFALLVPLLGLVGLLPLPISPVAQVLILVILAGPSIAAFFTTTNAIVADITTYDASVTGTNREAIYFGVQGFLLNVGQGLAEAFAAWELRFLGSSPTRTWGVRLGPLVSGIFAFASFLIFKKYSLKEMEPTVATRGVKEVDAVVLAGSHKAYTPIFGRPSVEFVVKALEATPRVKDIVVVAGSGLSQLQGTRKARIIPAVGDEADNLFAGVESLHSGRRILLVTGDSPLLTPGSIEAVLNGCETKAEICYPFVNLESVKSLFPDRKWVSLRLEGEKFTGSNMLIFDAKALARVRPFAERVLRIRRETIKALLTAGPLFALLLLLGKARLAYVEGKAERITGCVCQGLPLPLPELAMDVDYPEDVARAESYLSERERGRGSVQTARGEEIEDDPA